MIERCLSGEMTEKSDIICTQIWVVCNIFQLVDRVTLKVLIVQSYPCCHWITWWQHWEQLCCRMIKWCLVKMFHSFFWILDHRPKRGLVFLSNILILLNAHSDLWYIVHFPYRGGTVQTWKHVIALLPVSLIYHISSMNLKCSLKSGQIIS